METSFFEPVVIPQVNGSEELLVTQWCIEHDFSILVDFPVSPLWPGGQRPVPTPVATSTSTTCPKCDRTVIIPVIAGVFGFLFFVGLMLHWGRRQVCLSVLLL